MNIKGATVERRLELLEARAVDLGRNISEVGAAQQRETTERKAAVSELKGDVHQLKESVVPMVVESVVGDWRWEVWGVALFIFGVVLTTAGGVMN